MNDFVIFKKGTYKGEQESVPHELPFSLSGSPNLQGDLFGFHAGWSYRDLGTGPIHFISKQAYML